MWVRAITVLQLAYTVRYIVSEKLRLYIQFTMSGRKSHILYILEGNGASVCRINFIV